MLKNLLTLCLSLLCFANLKAQEGTKRSRWKRPNFSPLKTTS